MRSEDRVELWVRTRIGPGHMNRKERAMRLFEEAAELAQAEGITAEQLVTQIAYVFTRPGGEPSQEAGGVAVCIVGYCAGIGTTFLDVLERELRRIEAKPISEIRGSLARKADSDLVFFTEGK